MRIGFGYDLHRLVPDRPLILGGVSVPHTVGLAGHSDADVLTHAVCDALLGAAALGDLGTFFPDTDAAFKDMDSLEMLVDCTARVHEAGYSIGNVDATLIAQSPKLAPHRDPMRTNLATAMSVEVGRVSVKFTTTEGCDATGRGEAMAAHAVVLLTPAGD